MLLCLLLCTFGTAAFCDEQAASHSLLPKTKDPNLEFKIDELPDAAADGKGEHYFLDISDSPNLLDNRGRFNSNDAYLDDQRAPSDRTGSGK